MLEKIRYFISNKQILAKIFVIKNYILLGLFTLISKPYFLFKKENVYFFQDRPFGIDNAFFLYKYYKKNHPEIKAVYLVQNKSDAEYKKVLDDNNIVYNFSFKHFWYFIASEKIIYSFDTAPFYFFGKIGVLLKNLLKPHTKLIFLGHGTTRVHIPFFNKENNIFSLFMSSGKQEKDFLDKNFGYNQETVITGLPRFDNLHKKSTRKKQIFFFPTWDNKLNGLSDHEFIKTDYFREVVSILNSIELGKWLEDNDYLMYYYPHQGILKYSHLFTSKHHNIIMLQDSNKYNISISQLILESTIFLTNYSSIVFDFAYQAKPIIYYDIGKDHYNKKAPYYYSFGEHLNTISALIHNLDGIIKRGGFQTEKHKNNTTDFFQNIDGKNCERTSLLINNL